MSVAGATGLVCRDLSRTRIGNVIEDGIFTAGSI
jgi:hypothetical protein